MLNRCKNCNVFNLLKLIPLFTFFPLLEIICIAVVWFLTQQSYLQIWGFFVFISVYVWGCFVELCSFAQSCPTLCDPMDIGRPGSNVHEIFQARIMEWVTISFSRVSSQPRNRTSVSCVSCIAGRSFTHWAIREAQTEDLSVFLILQSKPTATDLFSPQDFHGSVKQWHMVRSPYSMPYFSFGTSQTSLDDVFLRIGSSCSLRIPLVQNPMQKLLLRGADTPVLTGHLGMTFS